MKCACLSANACAQSAPISAVLSITQIHAGSAYNVIPSEAKLCGTVRAFSDEVRVLIRERMRAICADIGGAVDHPDSRRLRLQRDPQRSQTLRYRARLFR